MCGIWQSVHCGKEYNEHSLAQDLCRTNEWAQIYSKYRHTLERSVLQVGDIGGTMAISTSVTISTIPWHLSRFLSPFLRFNDICDVLLLFNDIFLNVRVLVTQVDVWQVTKSSFVESSGSPYPYHDPRFRPQGWRPSWVTLINSSKRGWHALQRQTPMMCCQLKFDRVSLIRLIRGQVCQLMRLMSSDLSDWLIGFIEINELRPVKTVH